MSESIVTVQDMVKRDKVVLPAGTMYYQSSHWDLTGTLEQDTVATARILTYGHPDNHLRQITFVAEGLNASINLLVGRDVEFARTL